MAAAIVKWVTDMLLMLAAGVVRQTVTADLFGMGRWLMVAAGMVRDGGSSPGIWTGH